MIPRITGSGGREIAEGQAARLDRMAIVLAFDLDNWGETHPDELLFPGKRAAAVERINRWRQESNAWKQRIAEWDGGA